MAIVDIMNNSNKQKQDKIKETLDDIIELEEDKIVKEGSSQNKELLLANFDKKKQKD